jgi:hypothetical protein
LKPRKNHQAKGNIMLHDLLDWLAAMVTAFVSASAPIIAYALLKQLGLQKDDAARAMVTTALERGTGVIVNDALIKGEPLIANKLNHSPGLTYVLNTVGPQLKRLGISPDEVGTKLSSQLALTLHTSFMHSNSANVAPSNPPVAAALPVARVVTPAATVAAAKPAGPADRQAAATLPPPQRLAAGQKFVKRI